MILATPVNLLLALAGIHGAVRSAGDGGPLAGVRIEIDVGMSTSSDTAGHYSATGLVPGPHEIRFVAAGQQSIDNQVPAERYLIDLPTSVQRFRIVVGQHTVRRWPEDPAGLTPRRTPSGPVVLDLAHLDVP